MDHLLFFFKSKGSILCWIKLLAYFYEDMWHTTKVRPLQLKYLIQTMYAYFHDLVLVTTSWMLLVPYLEVPIIYCHLPMHINMDVQWIETPGVILFVMLNLLVCWCDVIPKCNKYTSNLDSCGTFLNKLWIKLSYIHYVISKNNEKKRIFLSTWIKNLLIGLFHLFLPLWRSQCHILDVVGQSKSEFVRVAKPIT